MELKHARNGKGLLALRMDPRVCAHRERLSVISAVE